MTLEYMYHHEEARLCYLSTCIIARRHYSDTLVHLQLLVDATVTLELRLGTFTTTSKHFVCLIRLFTSHQQSFSLTGMGLPGLNQY